MTAEEKFRNIQELFFKSGLSDEDGHLTIFGYYYAAETFSSAVADKIKRIFWQEGAYVVNVPKLEDIQAYANGIELPKDVNKWNLLWWDDITDDIYNNLIELFGFTIGRWTRQNAYYIVTKRKFDELTRGQVKYNMVVKEMFIDDPSFETILYSLQYDFTAPEWNELKL